MATNLLPFASHFHPNSLSGLKYFPVPTCTDIVTLSLFASATVGYLLRRFTWDKPDPLYYKYFERPQQKVGDNGVTQQSSRNIVKELQRLHKQVVVFWGSQSGTAEDLAHRLAKDCQRRLGLGVIVADLSDYDPESIVFLTKDHVAVFILSTFGEGDPSDNSAEFWGWINGNVGRLNSLQYTAFGLGNSNYKHYNRVVEVVVKALDEAGASSLLPVGKADDAEGNTKDDFIEWKEAILDMFRQRFDLEDQGLVYEPAWEVIEDTTLQTNDLHLGEPNHPRSDLKTTSLCSAIAPIPIKSSRELLDSRSRNCLHLDLDLTSYPSILYKTGDHLAVWPSNPVSEVEKLLTALDLHSKATIPIILRNLSDTKHVLPSPTTLQALFTSYLSIMAPLSRDTLLQISPFAPTSEARAKLQELGSLRKTYIDFTSQNYITLPRLLSTLCSSASWSDLPLSLVLEVLPRLQPRYYSISSSSVLSPRQPSITVSVSQEAIIGNPDEMIHGVASNYLLQHNRIHQGTGSKANEPLYSLDGPNGALEGTRIYAHIRKSKFKLPISATVPLILIAAGTGIAPFRAFITERAKLKMVGREVGTITLFFGCRRQEEFLYRD